MFKFTFHRQNFKYSNCFLSIEISFFRIPIFDFAFFSLLFLFGYFQFEMRNPRNEWICLVFAFPFVSVRETVVCRWNAVSFSLKGFPKSFSLEFFLFLFFFASFFRIGFFLRNRPTDYTISRSSSDLEFEIFLREGFFFFPFLENFLLLLPCCAFIIAYNFQLSIVFVKKILIFCNFFSFLRNHCAMHEKGGNFP